ncbi:hypothetical protein HDU96_007654 [Phlyctochytrium bullatum]|nr:hypothetical protein HDU96_007654 [Phlyctochytrium bullatum]
MLATTTTTLVEEKPLRLVIVGGGPGGLCLASILQHHQRSLASSSSPPLYTISVYERDPHPDHRPQGGTLDLHASTGQHALKQAGLRKQFLKMARPEGQDLRILDGAGAIRFEEKGPGESGSTDRSEIDRGQLRKLLLDSLEPGTVNWGCTVSDVVSHDVDIKGERSERNDPVTFTVKQTLPDGTTTETHHSADLLVGADGAWSKVRPLVTPARPVYTGITFLDITLPNIDTTPLPVLPPTDPLSRFPTLGALLGQGSLFALAPGRGLIAQRNRGGVARVYAAFKVDSPTYLQDEAGMDFARDTAAELVNKALPLLEGFHPALRAFVAAAPDHDPATAAADVTPPIVPRPIYHFELAALPPWTPGPATATGPLLTLVGDAAHVMSPFAGEGVNLALADAAGLARVLLSPRHRGQLQLALRQYEAEMGERLEEPAGETMQNLGMMFNEEAPGGMVKQMEEYQGWLFPIKYVAGRAWKMMSRGAARVAGSA